MEKIVRSKRIVVVGAGGLGSVIAENLVHVGFRRLLLIDHDFVEKTNLNRIVGAKYNDARDKLKKVQAVKRHLLEIAPSVSVHCMEERLEDIKVNRAFVDSSFIIVATDNHSSRFKAQELAFQYFIPLVSVGVNITVEEGEIMDYSGEVITIRIGDGLCLNCLGRLSPTNIASDRNVDTCIGKSLVEGGYVQGMDVKEPAVKTLNSIVASMAVEELVNQFTGRIAHHPIRVYERNTEPKMYNDQLSVQSRHSKCATCRGVNSHTDFDMGANTKADTL